MRMLVWYNLAMTLCTSVLINNGVHIRAATVCPLMHAILFFVAFEFYIIDQLPVKALQTTLCGSWIPEPNMIEHMPTFPEGTGGQIKKVMTQELWEKYHDAKDKSGFPFKQVIYAGCKNVKSDVGVFAGSHDSYTTFADIFDPIIYNLHGYGRRGRHVSKMSTQDLNCQDFASDEAAMIVSTRIKLSRNFLNFPLGPHITAQDRLIIREKVRSACETFTGDLAGVFNNLEDMADWEKEDHRRNGRLFKDDDPRLRNSGLQRDWPDGRG